MKTGHSSTETTNMNPSILHHGFLDRGVELWVVVVVDPLVTYDGGRILPEGDGTYPLCGSWMVDINW